MTITRSAERSKFLLDVFTTAIEGGISYWSVVTKYHWTNAKDGEDLFSHEDITGFFATIVPNGENTTEAGVPAWGVWDDDDPRETAPLVVDADVIANGLGLYRRWAAGKIDFRGDEVPLADQAARKLCSRVVLADRTNYGEGDIDAGDADVIIQWGLFSEVVFG